MDRTQLRPAALEDSPILDAIPGDLASGADAPTGPVPPASTGTDDGSDASPEAIDPRSWRGVFAVEYPDEVLFTKRIDIRPDQLDEWKPEPVSGRRRGEDDE